MDNRTFWLGILGGLIGGAVIAGLGYLAIKAYLPSQEGDPLYKMKRSFIQYGTDLARAATWEEIFFLYRERDHVSPGAAPLTS